MVQCRWGEPSTLRACIADGSDTRGRTVHGGGRYHGWFGVQSGTFHAEPQYRGWFSVDGVNRPRYGHESRMVQIPEGEPSTVAVDIMDGSTPKVGPSTLRVDITEGSYLKSEPSTFWACIADGSESKAEPSMLGINIADGSMSVGRTFHAGGSISRKVHISRANHPRSGHESRTVRGPERNLPR